MGCAAGRLELKCGELDVEVTDEALLQLVEEGTAMAKATTATIRRKLITIPPGSRPQPDA